MALKEKIEPVYAELKGLLNEAPIPKTNYERIEINSLWEHFNSLIDELNGIIKTEIEISEVDESDLDGFHTNYDSYKISIKYYRTNSVGHGGSYVDLVDYRSKLSSLINRLRSEYHFDVENTKESSTPQVVNIQNQQQTQDQRQIQMVSILLEIQSKIDEKLSKSDLGKEERGFLQKVKDSLPGITSVTQLISSILTGANDIGMTIDKLKNIFY